MINHPAYLPGVLPAWYNPIAPYGLPPHNPGSSFASYYVLMQTPEYQQIPVMVGYYDFKRKQWFSSGGKEVDIPVAWQPIITEHYPKPVLGLAHPHPDPTLVYNPDGTVREPYLPRVTGSIPRPQVNRTLTRDDLSLCVRRCNIRFEDICLGFFPFELNLEPADLVVFHDEDGRTKVLKDNGLGQTYKPSKLVRY